MFNKQSLATFDPQLAQAIADEAARQEHHLELIASENYVSPLVLEAQGSILTNKYAEGYPGKRYYGGCEFVDVVESLAISRAQQLFSCDFVNVQPHSGSQANAAVFQALLKPGDTFIGMDLSNGGHLTHGSKVNFSGANYNAISYSINDQGLIDYDELAKLALEHRPKLILGGFSAYSQQIDWSILRKIADSVGAYLFVDMAHVAGLIVAGIYPDPIPHAHVVTTTTHKTLAGPRGGLILSNAQDPVLYKKLNSGVFPGIQGGPLMHIIAAKAVAFKEALEPSFKELQQRTLANAQIMTQVLISRGYKIVSNGTMNHLFLVDLIDQGITGKEADAILSQANITVNKNSVPNDPQSPFVTSGIRIGTPAMSRRGFDLEQANLVANWIADLLDSKGDPQVIAQVKQQVIELCNRFPVYSN